MNFGMTTRAAERDLREHNMVLRLGRSLDWVDLIFAARQLQERCYEYGKDVTMAL